MFCKQCGQKLDPSSAFCTSCGAKVVSNNNQANQQEYTTREPFREYNSLGPEQNDSRNSFFKGKQASIGTSGGVKFKKKKKGGIIKKLLTLIILAIVGLFAYSFFFGSNISSLATATNVDVNTLEPINVVSTFDNDTPEIFATFSISGLPIGTDIQGEWVYEGEQIVVAEMYTTEEAQNGYFSFTIPDAGWPSGSYEINIYIQGEYATGKKFTVR